MNIVFYLLILISIFLADTQVFSQAMTPEEKKEFEEFRKVKKEQDAKRKKEQEEQDYRDFLEFKEYQKSKSNPPPKSKEIEELERKREEEYLRKEKIRLEGKSKFNNFSVQYFGGAGIVNGKNSVSGSVTVFQVLFEYQPVNSNLGFRAGINSYSYSVTKTSQWNQAILAAYYSPQLFLAYTAVSNNFLPAQSTQGYGFDTILDYHFQPRKPFDPYLFVGIGIGSCANACSVYRGTIGAGFKANLHDGYFIAEAFGEKPNFIFTQQFFTPSFNLFSYGLKFGFGIYLDI